MVALLACLALLLTAIIVLVITRARYKAALGREGPPPNPIHRPLALSLASLIILTGPGMAFVGAIPPVPSLFGELACPPGWTYDPNVSSRASSIGGSGIAGACAEGPRPSWVAHHTEVSWLFRFACFFFIAALAASVGLVLTLRRWRALS
jgi:hypothetical protein